MVLVLTACPPGLRGYITRWLLEASPGVFVGRLSARVRENLWDLVVAERKLGKALLIYSTTMSKVMLCARLGINGIQWNSKG